MSNSPALRPRSVSDKPLGRSHNSLWNAALRARSGEADGKLTEEPPASDTDKSQGRASTNERPKPDGQRRGRARGATISGTQVTPVVEIVQPTRSGSTWGLDDGRMVVQQVAPASTYPYIVSKAEDIDSILEAADAAMEKIKGKKSGVVTRSSSFRSPGPGDRLNVRDIDDLTTANARKVEQSTTPRHSLATRLASGFRLSTVRPNSAQLSAGLGGSSMSFADNFPTIGRSTLGLAAPVPLAPANSLPESHFPQTLTTASEDIDRLTGIGSGENWERTGSKLTVDIPAATDDFDVDNMLALGSASPSENPPQSQHSPSTRMEKPRVKNRLGFHSARITGTAPMDGPDSPATSPVSPNRKSPVTSTTITPAEEETRDIDDVLSMDPNPAASVLASLPRVFTDADDYLLVNQVPPIPKILIGEPLMPKRKSADKLNNSLPLLAGQDMTSPDTQKKSVWHSTGSLKYPLGVAGDSSRTNVLDGGMERVLTTDSVRHKREQTPPIFCLRDDTRAAEDIGAFIDIGTPLVQSTEILPENENTERDIEMLLGAGDATSASTGLETIGASSPPQGRTTIAGTHPLQAKSAPSHALVRSMNALDRSYRVSFIEIDNAIEARHSTNPQASAMAIDPASLDIDQFVAGERPTFWPKRGREASAKSRTSLERSLVASSRLGLGENDKHEDIEHKNRPRAFSEPQRGSGSEVNASKLMKTLSPPVQRRLTSLDINHFMGIADTIEADSSGLPMGASAMRIGDVGGDSVAPDIKEYIGLGRPVDGQQHSLESSADDVSSNPQSNTEDMLVTDETGTSYSAVSSSVTSSALHRLERRASSTGHLAQIQRDARRKRQLHNVNSHSSAAMLGSQPRDNGAQSSSKPTRKRGSLDELAFLRKRQYSSEGPRGPEVAPLTVTASIVELTPPKIDIDELLCWGREFCAVMERKFSVATHNTNVSGHSRPASAIETSTEPITSISTDGMASSTRNLVAVS
ncbi:uncharacterized protein SPPG_00969 [Spizellomyces punctatus DAOM BR117]|uniref:Uncharacterized protein n=1 Tax=Spizellomyces punctatus (strain DAOM BR117) TaxID=645134 RepID=A0A0L0HRB7_SPIPD|nr:uncharacterized protein SPPG_00969 [Spizellomyces punctatus DAOM BR117]KND03485.1 hypothetical protein SPPG_00969 [Spizellomyces punctatus DAOM BR117]|eukprot:XP_016611524.1 hypothetical protein SPPG_00969 [Spizellomyces punctatus DAOM BR117]